ncbi:PLD nuclease N-terminal domain-containing protein [Arcanobacterium phocae]|uniref:PLD nuclease N-terminal domain-containing protein n=1 Tax=Arcanobacterium phocae TaxID=131112 RepID=UPI001C0EE0C2|nr:PLD nuclease N-terminal domain-containing protein [Arcanobacterium phocae]
MNLFDSLSTLPNSALIALGIVAVIQLCLMIWALVRLSSDKREQVVGISRFAWAIIILLGQLIGPIIFLIFHIKETRELDQQRTFQESLATSGSNLSKDSSTVLGNLYRK